MNFVKLKGERIIGCNGEDNTGALAELGVPYVGYSDKEAYYKICQMVFEVPLDFVLRHGRLDAESYEVYKTTEEYKKYFNEGREAYLNGTDEVNNPYDTATKADENYWFDSIYRKRYPWYDGYRKTEIDLNFKEYNLKEFEREFKELCKKYQLITHREDEYGYLFLKTKRGYIYNL